VDCFKDVTGYGKNGQGKISRLMNLSIAREQVTFVAVLKPSWTFARAWSKRGLT
jgi:hypothetical protein